MVRECGDLIEDGTRWAFGALREAGERQRDRCRG